MKKQKVKTIHTRSPQSGRQTLLAAALIAAGYLSQVSMPLAMAAPLPMPCGGCLNNSHVSVPFLQSGTLANFYIDPITNLPVPTPVIDGHTMTINQTSQTAILNWQQFNIDHGYTVEFKQPNSTSSTLNRIWDADPSIIAGSLKANGQIYLINQNGIVFANGSNVDTGALIASSLDINSDLYTKGYLTNTEAKPAFGDVNGIIGIHGFVRVDSGAVLNGSRIMLFAPVVENNGTINTAGGQVVLAAGQKVYLEASQDPSLRGVLVEVDVSNPGVADPPY